MSKYQLEDKLIEGTGTFQRAFPTYAEREGVEVGPRIFPVTVRQRECMQGDEFVDAYEFIGAPVDGETLTRIRTENGLSENYGAILFPKSHWINIDLDSSDAIIEERDDSYLIRGLLPTEQLRWESNLRGYKLGKEGNIYVAQEDFPNLDPNALIQRWSAEPMKV